MGSTRRLEAIVEGRVQGVGFRFFVRECALSHGLSGWVANAPNGTVTCVAEGPGPDLERFLDDLRNGPSGARVDAVRERWFEPTGRFDRFAIVSGAHAGD